MNQLTYKIFERKVVIRLRDRLCETPEELLNSDLFHEIVLRSISQLKKRQSVLLKMFNSDKISSREVELLIQTLKYLSGLTLEETIRLLPDAECFRKNQQALRNYIEFLYNYWRYFDRFIICNSEGDTLDKRPYRTFHTTIEHLTHMVRRVYRDIEEKIGFKPRVYRQLPAGANMAAISVPLAIPLAEKYGQKLGRIPVIRQVLLYPPLVLEQPMNKRGGRFERIHKNPFDVVQITGEEWICYPVQSGPVNILVYIHEHFFELGFSLANLFAISGDEELKKTPDGIFLFGVPGDVIDTLGENPTVFYDDEENDLLVGAVPCRDQFGYFGYLKKMILTLHNIKMMKRGRLPFHGALTRILLGGEKDVSILIVGDTGAGKSETLEAFQNLGNEWISDHIVIADDMGSLQIQDSGAIMGYGTETGAFLRLDDLSPTSTFGAMDRAIFMNPSQVNARVVIPITQLEDVLNGAKIDYFLYANNHEAVSEHSPVLEAFQSPEQALAVFREGKTMAKGTTTASGLQHSYFANIFGPPEYRELHEHLAERFFQEMFKTGVFVGQIRTQLGIPGKEQQGPQLAAQKLIEKIRSHTAQ